LAVVRSWEPHVAGAVAGGIGVLASLGTITLDWLVGLIKGG
jgi:hypothetical protein